MRGKTTTYLLQKQTSIKEKPQVQRRTNYLTRYISSGKHKKADKSCNDCIVFPLQDKLPNGLLPTGKQVLGYLFYTYTQNHGPQQDENPHHVVADIMNHWIACNIYTVTYKSVREKLEKMSTTYTTLKKHPAKKKGETFSNNLKHFAKECESLFDIRTSYKNIQKTQEKLWNVK